MELFIKAVTVHELEQLREVSIATFKETFADQNTPSDMELYLEQRMNVDQIKKELLNPNCAFYFAYHQKHLIGYLKLNFNTAQSENVLEGKAFEIERIYLLKAHKRKGFGNELFQLAVRLGKEKNYTKLWLGVWEHNHTARLFYKKLGLVPLTQHTFLLGRDKQTDLLLQLEI